VSASLRRDVRASAGLTIVTGGQTGVDTFAALAALRAGLPVHLIFPAGLRQEDGSLTPSRR
jgi:predicted Rossmann fold nucleotide-binding protein DprA/Smf involved in DNA uptake